MVHSPMKDTRMIGKERKVFFRTKSKFPHRWGRRQLGGALPWPPAQHDKPLVVAITSVALEVSSALLPLPRPRSLVTSMATRLLGPTSDILRSRAHAPARGQPHDAVGLSEYRCGRTDVGASRWISSPEMGGWP